MSNFRKRIAKRKTRKNKVKSFSLAILTVFLILFLLLADKLTGKNIMNFILGKSDKQIVSKNPDSLIISAYADKDYMAVLPLVTYNSVTIDWGDRSSRRIYYK